MDNPSFEQFLDYDPYKPRLDIAPLLGGLVDKYDLRHMAYGCFRVPGRNPLLPLAQCTYDKSWADRYLSQGYVAVDPIWTSALYSTRPTDWSDYRDESGDLKRFAGEQKEFGVGRHGLTVPVHGGQGEVGFITVTSDFADRDWADFKREMGTRLYLTASRVHAIVMEGEGAYTLGTAECRLTPRERECLQWAAAGKTGQDIGSILGISERVVRIHLDSTRRKLDAINITHAVSRGLALGLICHTG